MFVYCLWQKQYFCNFFEQLRQFTLMVTLLYHNHLDAAHVMKSALQCKVILQGVCSVRGSILAAVLVNSNYKHM